MIDYLATLLRQACPTVTLRYGVPKDEDSELITYNITAVDSETMSSLDSQDYHIYSVDIYVKSLLYSTMDSYCDEIRDLLDDYQEAPFDGIFFDSHNDDISEKRVMRTMSYLIYFTIPAVSIDGSSFSDDFNPEEFF